MDSNAVRKTYTPWPTRAFADFDVESVRSALRNLEMGNLGPAAILADAMTRDERIGAGLDVRIKGLMGLPLEIGMDSGDGRKRSAITKEVKARYDAGEFGGRAALRRWQRYGLLLGVCFAQNIYDTESVPGRWIPKLTPWHPAHFRYDTSRGTWVCNTKEGPLDIDLNSGKWSVYALADESPWLESLVRRLAIPWLIRQFAYRDWARYSEVHGLPIRKAKIPAAASKEQKDNFWSGIVALGNESTIEIPELGNEQGAFDIELVEAASRSYEGFQRLLEKCEASIAITILGQNLTTEVKGGSLAAARVHENVMHDIITEDAVTFCEALRDGILKPFAVFNYGDVSLTPFLKIDTDPPNDLKQDAETMNTVADALSKFDKIGYTIDPKEIEDKYGFKLKTVEPKQGPNVPGVGPDGKPIPANPGSGGDGKTQNDPPAPQNPPKKPAQAKAGAKPIQLASGYLAGASSGFIQGQLYADAVTDYGRLAVNGAVNDDLATLGQIINEAGSYDELRDALAAAFADKTPDEFTEVLHKALILANLGGRHAVLEDL